MLNGKNMNFKISNKRNLFKLHIIQLVNQQI